jgi:hypothetical protein
MRHRQTPARLIQQLLAVHRNQHAVTFLGGSLGNVAENPSLSAAGTQNGKNFLMA